MLQRLNTSSISSRTLARRVIAGAAIALFATGCATSGDLPQAEFESTERALSRAQDVKAGSYASDELLAAQRKLTEARASNRDGDEAAAERLLHEARLHAEAARFEALSAQSRESLKEINAGLATLEQELYR